MITEEGKPNVVGSTGKDHNAGPLEVKGLCPQEGATDEKLKSKSKRSGDPQEGAQWEKTNRELVAEALKMASKYQIK